MNESTLFEICEMNSIVNARIRANCREWTNHNEMKINSEKSKEMIISYAHGNLGNDVPNILL